MWPDREKLFSILSSDFDVNVLRGEVTVSNFKIALRLLLARDTSVAVLAFCGHGVYEHAAGYHGSLVCSFSQRISGVVIEDIVAENKFRGTFVRILNMCDASSDVMPSNASAEPIGRAQRDLAARQTHPMEPLAAYQGMMISASAPFTTAYGNSKGSYLVKALGALFAKVPAVTYEGLESVFNSSHVGDKLVELGALHRGTDAVMVKEFNDQLRGCSVSTTPGLGGVFSCRSFQVSSANTSDSESDSEL